MRDAEGGAGQSILRNLIPAEFAIDASLENRNGAVGKLDDFFHIGRNHDNCNARILELTDDVVYVAARSDVYNIIRKLKDAGVAVIMVSSDMEEVVELADRAITVFQGRINGEFSRDEITQDALTSASFGIAHERKV